MNMIDPVQILKARLRERTYRDLAVEMQMSAAYLHQVVSGKSRASPRLLDQLGIERVVIYRRKKKPKPN